MEHLEWERLARAYSQRVFRFAYARLGNRQDAEDVTQETFLRLVRAAPEFPDDTRALAWLFQVAANCVSDLFRLSWRRREVSVEELPETQGEGPEEGDALMADGALKAVLALPPKYRAVIHLFYYEDRPITEIAEILRLTPSAVKTRLTRAREQLKMTLKEGAEYV